ncbi:hypothetical protein LTR86_000811 [Recurvomyces mirabilis]|nr:hypothetical protein LTR86_000811 [Recurvomyces mirabilis]
MATTTDGGGHEQHMEAAHRLPTEMLHAFIPHLVDQPRGSDRTTEIIFRPTDDIIDNRYLDHRTHCTVKHFCTPCGLLSYCGIDMHHSISIDHGPFLRHSIQQHKFVITSIEDLCRFLPDLGVYRCFVRQLRIEISIRQIEVDTDLNMMTRWALEDLGALSGLRHLEVEFLELMGLKSYGPPEMTDLGLAWDTAGVLGLPTLDPLLHLRGIFSGTIEFKYRLDCPGGDEFKKEIRKFGRQCLSSWYSDQPYIMPLAFKRHKRRHLGSSSRTPTGTRMDVFTAEYRA